MSTASNLGVLKRRIDDYLWRDKSLPLVTLRAVLAKSFGEFDKVAIIGGLIRDLARKGPAGFKSDVDLVIDAEDEQVRDLARRLGAKQNRFGGFCYKHQNWKIDFWALETTWASKQGHVNVEKFYDLTLCTFFDWDAVLYDIHYREVICDLDYLDLLKTGQLDINLLANPSLKGNLLRAVRRLLLWNAKAGPRLSDFIDEHLSQDVFDEISKVEQSIYGNPILSRFPHAGALHRQLSTLEGRSEFDTTFAQQLTLPEL